MTVQAGKLNTRFTLYRDSAPATDDWGVPIPKVEEVRRFWAEVKTQSGVGTIRDGSSSGMPLSTLKYSLRVRRKVADDARPGDRLVANSGAGAGSAEYRVEGAYPDLAARDFGYIIAFLNVSAVPV